MNDLKERYIDTALDEFHNGGPSPELEQRILAVAPAVTAATSRWWLVPAACALLALGVTAALLYKNDEPAVAPVGQEPAASPAPAPVEQVTPTPAGLGSKYRITETEPAKDDQTESNVNEFEPDPAHPITIDFVQKDLHTVMHYIALRSGLQIIVEGEADIKLTVMIRRQDPKEALMEICRQNNLDYIEDGNVIIIKRRPQEEKLADLVMPDDFEPDPDEPIDLDPVAGKDLLTVLHYIALRSGLQIIVEGDLSGRKHTFTRRKVKPRDAIQSICKANKLDYIEDGKIIIIKTRPKEAGLANVLAAENELYNVDFEDHELVAAIMEVATVTKTQVFVPAIGRGVEDSEETERVGGLQTMKITLFMKLATPDAILRRLAELGELNVEVVELDDSSGEKIPAYKFTYRD